ncbi:unnamed protein product [Closterium sp. NIES-54]
MSTSSVLLFSLPPFSHSFLQRELPPEQQPVVAALTADVGSGIESECKAAGMNSYLSKPVSKPALQNFISRCLSWKQKGAIDPLKSGAMDGSSSREGGIQLLLAAEQEAQKVVAAARAAKTARLRQAKEEAEREAAAYRAQREEEYRKKKAGVSVTSP